MTVAITSKIAYASIDNLGDKQREVLEKIEEIQPCSNKQIARSLGWEINRVTGRVNELAKKGFIKCAGMAMGETGRPEKVWEVKDETR